MTEGGGSTCRAGRHATILAPCCAYPPPRLQSPPPHPGDRHFHVFLVNMYCAGLCCPSALRMALHCFPITSNQAPVCVLWYSLSKGVVWVCCVATSDPRCFLPVTMYGTTHAHLVHMCLHRWRVPQFALKYPCNPPPPPGDRHLATVSPPHPGDRCALTREFARGGQGTPGRFKWRGNDAPGTVLFGPRGPPHAGQR